MEQLARSLMTRELHLSSNTESSKNKSLALKAQFLEDSKVDEEEMAMLVKRFKKMINNRKFDKNKKYTSSKDTTCFKCGAKDHFNKDCPLKEGKNKGKEKSKESRVYKPYFTKDNVKKPMLAAWGDTDSEEEEDQPPKKTAHLCLMAKTDEKAKLKELEAKVPVRGDNTWYIDSGCSKHMTRDKSRFLSLEAYYGGTVTFGNNIKGDIIAIGKDCDDDFEIGLVRKQDPDEESTLLQK